MDLAEGHRPVPHLYKHLFSICACSQRSDGSSLWSHGSLSPPDLPPITALRITERDTNDNYALHRDRPLPPVPRDNVLERRPSLPSRRRQVLHSISSSSTSSTSSCSSGYGSLPAHPRPPPPPPRLPPPRGKVTLLRTVKLHKHLINKWVTGVAFGKKGELIVVDLRDCFVVDPEDGSLKRQVGIFHN